MNNKFWGLVTITLNLIVGLAVIILPFVGLSQYTWWVFLLYPVYISGMIFDYRRSKKHKITN